MGRLRSKTRSHGLKVEKIVNTPVAAVLIQVSWKFVRKIDFIISRSSLNMSRLLSKARSQELKIEKSC
jgi:hypothetical protein